MDFSLFPQEVLSKIFGYLPLHEKVRVGRVSKFFLSTSDGILSKTKNIALSYKYNDRLLHSNEYDYLSNLLGKCSPGLEKLIFPDFYKENDNQKQERLGILFKYSFRRLIDLEISFHFHPVILRHIFKELPQLRRIKLQVYFDDSSLFRYPQITMENLESMAVGKCDEKSFRSLILYGPKLKEFHAQSCIARRETVDEFLAHNPALEILELKDFGGPSMGWHQLDRCPCIDFNRFKEFWHLKSLTALILDCGTIDSTGLIIDFERMVANFPLLTRLALSCVSVDGDQIKHLASLKNMTDIEISNIPRSGHRFVENAILDLAMNYKHLVRASFPLTQISFKTLLAFVSNNSRLNRMTIDRFNHRIDDSVSILCGKWSTDEDGIDQYGTNLEMLQSLVDTMKTNPFFLTIMTRGISCYDDWSHKYLESGDVYDFLDDLKKKQGIRLEVSMPKRGYLVDRVLI